MSIRKASSAIYSVAACHFLVMFIAIAESGQARDHIMRVLETSEELNNFFQMAMTIYAVSSPSPLENFLCSRPKIQITSLAPNMVGKYDYVKKIIFLDVDHLMEVESIYRGATEFYLTHEYTHAVMDCHLVHVDRHHCYMTYRGMFEATAKKVEEYRLDQDLPQAPFRLFDLANKFQQHYGRICHHMFVGN
jgi:hypothetical protein